MSAPPAHLGDFMRRLAAAHGERAAVAGPDGAVSFTGLDRAADAWAAALLADGGGRGKNVGLLAGNGPDWLTAAFGVWRAGATLVPISTFVTAPELGRLLIHADVDTLIVQPHLRSHDYLAALARAGTLPRLRRVVVLGAAAPPPYRSAMDFLAAGAPRTAVEVDPEAIACILYTSGTTGEPKGVRLSHRAILATVVPTAARTGLTAADSLLSTLPLFWVAGLVIRALPTLATGCTLLLVESFTADAVLGALRRHRPTALHLRPPQVGQILAHPDFRPELLATVRRGGGRVEWYAPHLDAERCRLITGYGMTELAGYVVALDWRDTAAVRSARMGTPLPGVELRIVDGAGKRCAPGVVGEIRVRGPGLFSGYYKQPRGTGLDADGFFMTGDLGSIDETGALEFRGRSKDLLRVKGINVSPLEVETVLGAHPQVDAVHVVGLPPDGLEQQVIALVVSRSPAAPPAEAELRALAAELSRYKRPEVYLFITRDAVPLSGTAKPQRRALAELAAGLLRHMDANEGPPPAA